MMTGAIWLRVLLRAFSLIKLNHPAGSPGRRVAGSPGRPICVFMVSPPKPIRLPA